MCITIYVVVFCVLLFNLYIMYTYCYVYVLLLLRKFRSIFGPRRDEVAGEWRRLHNEELNDFYTSPNIVRVIKSRRMRLAGHVARMGEERGCIGSCWGNRREGDH